jgi:hypothetical protein
MGKGASVMSVSSLNFANLSDEALSTLIQNLRSGFDKLMALGDDAFVGDREKKVCPPAQMTGFMLAFLADAEARLSERGINPKEVPGNDWLTAFLTNQP